MRSKTRAERYAKKTLSAKVYNLHFVATYFMDVGNMAFLSRALACFGGKTMHVIGKQPSRSELKRLSGGNSELVNWSFYSNPDEYLSVNLNNNYKLVCAELCESAHSIHTHKWDYVSETHIAVGNEMDGIPHELLKYGEKVFIPMVGRGFCLNTGQTGNILAYDYVTKSTQT